MTWLSPDRREVETERSDPWIELQEIVDRCMGNLELADRVISRFRESLEETVRRLQDAAGTGDLPQLAKRAHRLKGEASNIGSALICRLAGRVEEVSMNGLREAALIALNELVAACREFREQVFTLAELAQSPSSGSRRIGAHRFRESPALTRRNP